MTFEKQSEIVDKRILVARKYWSEFLSDLPIRVANLSSSNQTLNTNVEPTEEVNDAEKLKW